MEKCVELKWRTIKLNCGFTIVEIMIVVTIISLLLTIAIPNFVKSRTRSRDAACVDNMSQIASALKQVCMENDLDATNGGAGFAVGAIAWNAASTNNGWGVVGPASYLKTAPVCLVSTANAYMAGSNANGAFRILCPNITGHGAKFASDYNAPNYYTTQ